MATTQWTKRTLHSHFIFRSHFHPSLNLPPLLRFLWCIWFPLNPVQHIQPGENTVATMQWPSRTLHALLIFCCIFLLLSLALLRFLWCICFKFPLNPVQHIQPGENTMATAQWTSRTLHSLLICRLIFLPLFPPPLTCALLPLRPERQSGEHNVTMQWPSRTVHSLLLFCFLLPLLAFPAFDSNNFKVCQTRRTLSGMINGRAALISA